MESERVPLAEFTLEGRKPGVTRLLVTAVTEPSADLPLIAIVGESPGPLFITVAAVHGDEYEGPQAIWQVGRDLPSSSLHGTLLALPICNPWAYAAGLRTTPEALDGRNLARTFPGDREGSPTQRLAATLLAFVTRMRPALFLDLHSGGVRCRFLPMVGYRRGLGDEARSRAAARAFGIQVLWELHDHPGTFNAETARRGITTIGVEMTGAGGCLDEDVAANRAGILNLLRWLGMVRDRPAPEVTGPFRRTSDILAVSPGYVHPVRVVGDRVQAGETVARILSPFGDTVAEAMAPHDGDVWVTRHLRTTSAGELVGAVARHPGPET